MKVYVTKIEPLKKDMSEILALLDAKRRERMEKIKAEEKKLESLYAGLLIRYAYQHENKDLSWDTVKIDTDENGKPYFTNVEELYFSVSHSKGYCMAAFDDKPIGCDIQYKQKVESKIAERFFVKSEVALYQNETDERIKKDFFYKLWCMKEACSKLNADGIPSGLTRYTFLNDNSAFDETTKKNVNIKYYDELENYSCTVASNEKKEFPKYIELLEASRLY